MLEWSNISSDLNVTLTVNASSNATYYEDDYRFRELDLWYTIPVAVILGLFTVLTVGGNLLVLIAVATDRQLRAQRHTVLILNLAVFDMTLGATVFPFSASLEFLNDQWIFGRIFCSVWAAIDVLCCTGSIWSLVSIALDRLIGVTRPLAYAGIMTRRRMLLMIVVIWTLSLIISIVPFMGWSTPEERNPYKCNVQTDISYVLFSVSVSYYIPLVIIMSFYFRIYQAAARHVQSMRSGVKRGSVTNNDGTVMTLRIHNKRFDKSSAKNNNKSPLNSRENNNGAVEVTTGSGAAKLGKSFARQRKATITLTIIIFGFICMWQGFFLILPISVLCPQSCHIPLILWKILFWLGYCNSLMNPFIYAAASPEFRRAFKRILCCEFLSSSKRKRNLRYEMSIQRNPTTPTSSSATQGRRSRDTVADQSFSACLCLFRPCRGCFAPATSATGENLDDTPDLSTSDVLSVTHSRTASVNERTFLGFRRSKKTSSSADFMEDFPLGSLTLARLKNPTGESDLLYGSLQALQKVALEDNPKRSRQSGSSNNSNPTQEALLSSSSKSCGTQTPPMSLSVSPESSLSYHYVLGASAQDDAEL